MSGIIYRSQRVSTQGPCLLGVETLTRRLPSSKVPGWLWNGIPGRLTTSSIGAQRGLWSARIVVLILGQCPASVGRNGDAMDLTITLADWRGSSILSDGADDGPWVC